MGCVTPEAATPALAQAISSSTEAPLPPMPACAASWTRSGPDQWLHQRRLTFAAHLLKVERRKASDIYFDIGFATLSSFTQSFKSHYGVTPKVYQAAE